MSAFGSVEMDPTKLCGYKVTPSLVLFEDDAKSQALILEAKDVDAVERFGEMLLAAARDLRIARVHELNDAGVQAMDDLDPFGMTA